MFTVIKMATLIASLSTGKGTWAEVSKLIGMEQWSKIILIGNSFAKDNFQKPQNAEFIEIDPLRPLSSIKKTILDRLKEKVTDLEIMLNLTSGSGKEHMAILSALLSLGLGIRFVSPGIEGLEEL